MTDDYDMSTYFPRIIDQELLDWKDSMMRKPLLLRGARQVGKSSAVRHLGESFQYIAEVNFEKQRAVASFFKGDIDVRLIVVKLSAYLSVPIEAGHTLLFLDEIQECPEAIMALRFFKEDFPELHVVAAGSLLEFALQSLPTFGVGRIHSLFMYPLTFDEFLMANGQSGLMTLRGQADSGHPLDVIFHEKLVEWFRLYLMIGGMPEAVLAWTVTSDMNRCRQIQEDIVLAYEDDFNKYGSRINPDLLRMTMRGVCHQAGQNFVFRQVSADYRNVQMREALRLLGLAGLVTPVVATAGNGVPLDAEANEARVKCLFLDSGLLLAVLHLDGEAARELVQLIVAGTPQELVNRGGLVEMVAGLEIMRYKAPVQRPKLYYWEKREKSIAEVDYLDNWGSKVLPIEVKSGTQGGMKSLWMFMREKHLVEAVRCSLENFGEFTYVDADDAGAVRHVRICPLYALSQLHSRV